METYTAGELAHKFGVTVRTIQYYNKQTLLKGKMGSNGRRIYNNDDAIKLQQILFLKSFGSGYYNIFKYLGYIKRRTFVREFYQESKSCFGMELLVVNHCEIMI